MTWIYHDCLNILSCLSDREQRKFSWLYCMGHMSSTSFWFGSLQHVTFLFTSQTTTLLDASSGAHPKSSLLHMNSLVLASIFCTLEPLYVWTKFSEHVSSEFDSESWGLPLVLLNFIIAVKILTRERNDLIRLNN